MFKSLLLLLALLGASQGPQNPPYSIRVDAPLVTVDVAVSDANGRPITNLTKDDFVVLQDGQPQTIQSFSPVDSPYNIQLLIDRSTSMQDYWPLMEPALARFIAQLRPQDRISIGAFDERSRDVELLLDWREIRTGKSTDIPINPAIHGVQYAGALLTPGTSSTVSLPSKDFYLSLEWAVKRLAEVTGRKGIVAFTDGSPRKPLLRSVRIGDVEELRFGDAKDDGDFQDLLRVVNQARVPLYFIATNTDLNPREGLSTRISYGLVIRSRLEQLANASGGRVALPQQLDDTLALYQEIGQALGTSYTLGYSPSAAGGAGETHRIEIRGRGRELQIHQSRESYLVR